MTTPTPPAVPSSSFPHPLTARTWNTDMNEKRGLYEGLICTLNGKG